VHERARAVARKDSVEDGVGEPVADKETESDGVPERVCDVDIDGVAEQPRNTVPGSDQELLVQRIA
jgi:hypothetical protein